MDNHTIDEICGKLTEEEKEILRDIKNEVCKLSRKKMIFRIWAHPYELIVLNIASSNWELTILGRKVLQRLDEKALIDMMWAVEQDNQQIRNNEIYNKLSDEDKRELVLINIIKNYEVIPGQGSHVVLENLNLIIFLMQIENDRKVLIPKITDLGYAILDKMWEERYQFNRRKG